MASATSSASKASVPNGGTSVAADSNFMSASLASQIVALSGVGTLSKVDLDKRLAGKAVRVVPSISETTHGLAGNASPKDLETLVQLAHLYFTAPRLDSAAMQAFRNQVAPFLANRGADPNSVFGTIDHEQGHEWFPMLVGSNER